jgi:hypothetical protein
VVGVHLAVEQIDAGNLHGFDNGIDFGRVAAFREIGNAFDESLGHSDRRFDPATEIPWLILAYTVESLHSF